VDKKYYAGFDLGGTKMISLVMDADGKILSRERRETPGQDGMEAVLDAIIGCLDASLEQASISASDLGGIGMAVPGLVDPVSGDILSLTNLGIQDYPMGSRLQNRYACPVALENDVNAGVWGEYKSGSARNYAHVVGAFIGTGIGGGLILNGDLYRGSEGAAGEIGHMIIRAGTALCGCGQYGCVEALASRLSLSKDVVALAASGKLSNVEKKASTDIKKIKSSFFAAALKSNQKNVYQIIEKSAQDLGIALANLVNILNPQAILLGGGLVEKLGNTYTRMVEGSILSHAMPHMVKNLKVLVSSLGDDAVPLGAAQLARDLSFKK